VRDRTQVLHQLFARHPDAKILNRDALRFVVGGDIDLERKIIVVNVLLGQLQMPEFFERVGGVRDQFTDEDFLLRVERVNDDIEQLLDFGLKLEFLRSGGGQGMC
jgi:hypothetical protein